MQFKRTLCCGLGAIFSHLNTATQCVGSVMQATYVTSSPKQAHVNLHPTNLQMIPYQHVTLGAWRHPGSLITFHNLFVVCLPK